MGEKVPICVVGCGGMGHRHILAYRALEDSGCGNVEIAAVCDVQEDNAEFAAAEVERLFGRRPLVFGDLDEVLRCPDVAAVDVVTDGSTHHEVAAAALAAGKHALVEKPLGITVQACRAMIQAAQESGAVLATAENYRRDPPNRLARAVLDAGLLGEPFLMMQLSVGGGDEMAITPWRHLKEKGAIGLDMGAHYGDIIRYYMGEYDQVFGGGFIVEPVRRKPDHQDHPLESYRRRVQTYPETIEATGEDTVVALYRMKSGALAQLALGEGRGGQGWERSVHGQLGSLYVPCERTGAPVLLRLEGRELRGREILPLVPDFQLDEITACLFGEDGVVYELPADAPHPGYAIDARHLAIEYHDFGRAILEGGTPEVDGEGGMVAVAAILAAYESAVAGRSVRIEEVVSGDVCAYQQEIDEALGLV